MGFTESLTQGVQRFIQKEHDVVRLVARISPDGIASSSIFIKAFQRKSIKFVLSFVPSLSEDVLSDLHREEYSTLFFLDIGAKKLQDIEQRLHNKTIFILDHHPPVKFEEQQHLIHLNPNLFGIDGNTDISTAGISYLFVKELDDANIDLSYLGLIGALADKQHVNGFVQFNKTILDDAIHAKKIIITEGLKLHAILTQPLHKVLHESIDPYLPGVTGSEYAALRFLEQHHIAIKSGKNYKTYEEFTEEDIQKIISGLIVTTDSALKKPEDIYGFMYLLSSPFDNPVLRTLQEYVHVLHACSVLGKPSVGIGLCLQQSRLTEQALVVYEDYKKDMLDALHWFTQHKTSDDVLEHNTFVIINGGDAIRDTIMTLLVETLSSTQLYPPGTILIGTAHTLDNFVHVTASLSGDLNNSSFKETITPLFTSYSPTPSSTPLTCLIPEDKEEQFLQSLNETLSGHIAPKTQ